MKKFISVLCAMTMTITGFAYAQGGTHLMIRNELGGDQLCMDADRDHGIGDGSPVFVYRCHGRENQRWTVTQSVGGQSALVGVDGYCLDVRGASRQAGAPAELYQCHFGKNQRFVVQQEGHIKEVGSGKCLASVGTRDRSPIVLDYCQNSPNQIWLFGR
ncbi:RICIN domain-containing protein [Collimonas silvisoli]|uniref:RICIN domain-containing protein n=1 Tax=Collimonas silvisoli TaxID=2825884 RepID=UPI001B8B742D|nr:RICIN domain-containing protein [Collimonas silvisoli]